MKPYYSAGGIEIYHADCREVLPQLSGVDLVLADVPYSSGGFTRADRNASTHTKYALNGTRRILPDFSGDNRDQLSLLTWSSFWMGDVLKACKPGAVMGTFIDWRNLSVMTNAVQVAGWILRGISVWDKTEQTRPDMGWFRSQSEFIVWGSAGAMKRGHKVAGICSPGVFRHRVDIAGKEHLTQKPTTLMRDLIRTRDEWSYVVDPFMGSGSTLVAARDLGRRAVGIDIGERNCEIAAKRLQRETENQN